MPIEVRIDKQLGVVLRRVTGKVTTEELIANFIETLQHPDYRPGMRSLSDLREVHPSTFSADARKIGDFVVSRSKQTGSARAAIVVSQDASYGMVRVLQVFAQNSPMDIQVFRDMNEARTWLGLDEESA